MGVLFENKITENYNASFLSIFTEISQNEKEIFGENYVIINESFEDIKNKIVKFVTSVWNKIKSMYLSIRERIRTTLYGGDFAKFYDRYIVSFRKSGSETLGEYKFKKPKKNLHNILPILPYNINNIGKILGDSMDAMLQNSKLDNLLDEVKTGKYYEKLLNDVIPNTSQSTFKEDFENYYFESEKEYTKLPHDIITEIYNTLDSNNIIDILTKALKKNEKDFKEIINANENSLKKDNSEVTEYMVKTLKVGLAVNNLVNNEYLRIVKLHLSQCKSTFIKVASRVKK